MIGVGVIGAGHWGPNLIRNFHDRESSTVLRIVEKDERRREQLRQRFRDVPVVADAAQVFEDPLIHAVVIATPTSTHFDLALAALEAGKHVLVEKPITTNAAEGARLTELAKERGLVLMVGHVFLFNPSVLRVRQLLEAGELGKVYTISMIRTNLGPIRLDVNAAWDLASHDISVANFWLDGPPVSASALGGTWINPGVLDASFITLRYPSNILVHIHASWLSPRKCRDVTVVADRKMLTFDDLNLSEPIRIYDKQVTDALTRPSLIDNIGAYRASVREGDIHIPRVVPGEPLKAECDHFVECIRTGVPCRSGGYVATDVVRTLEAIDESVRQHGREVEVT